MGLKHEGARTIFASTAGTQGKVRMSRIIQMLSWEFYSDRSARIKNSLKNNALGLVIPVYRGGKFFRDCWESVRPFSDCFDSILVSLNRCDEFEDDLKYLNQNRVSNLTIIYPSEYLEPVEHFLYIFKHVQTRWIFPLCHDDMLVGENLEKQMDWLLPILQQGSTSIFGNYIIIDETGEELGIVDELAGTTMPIDRFIRYDSMKNWYTNVSGVIYDANNLKRHLHIVKRFKKGFRFEYFLLTLPHVSFVCSPQLPMVKIRWYPGQEGRQPYRDAELSDEMLYWLLQARWRADNFRDDFFNNIVIPILKGRSHLKWGDLATHSLAVGLLPIPGFTYWKPKITKLPSKLKRHFNRLVNRSRY